MTLKYGQQHKRSILFKFLLFLAWVGVTYLSGTPWRVTAQDGSPPTTGTFTLNAEVWTGGPKRLGTFTEATAPQVVVDPRGVLHVVWENQGRLYHMWRNANGEWSPPEAIFWGVTPSVALDTFGRLHLVFAQQVRDNFEIYYAMFDGQRWTLPRNISHTSGQSYSPYITIAPDGTLYVVWNDTTPGRNVIYSAQWQAPVWTNAPVLQAWGKAPSLYVGPSLEAHLLWQGNSLLQALDIFHLLRRANGWDLPQNLSDTPGTDSLNVQGVLDYSGTLHVIWQEESPRGYRVFYTMGKDLGWLWPEALSDAGVVDSGISTSERGTFVHVWWGDGVTWWTRWRAVASLHWSAPIQFLYAGSRVIDVQFAPWNTQQLHALWWEQTLSGVNLWYAQARTPVRLRIYLAQMGVQSPWQASTTAPARSEYEKGR